jgi:hypothetical protein
MTRKIRSENELIKASDALAYEVWMFQSLASVMHTGSNLPRVMKNALLEAFLVHTRNLIDFLYSKKGTKPDDIVIDDFYGVAPHLQTALPAKSEALIYIEPRINKFVSHLTYKRIETAPTPEWPYPEITDELNMLINIFVISLPENILGPRWKELDLIVTQK